MSTKPTNAQQFVADLGAGTFANQLVPFQRKTKN